MDALIGLAALILSLTIVVAFFVAVLELKAIHRTVKQYGRLIDFNMAAQKQSPPPPIRR